MLTTPELLPPPPAADTKSSDTPDDTTAPSSTSLDDDESVAMDARDDTTESKLPTLNLSHIDSGVVAYILRYLYASALATTPDEFPPTIVPRAIATDVQQLAQLLDNKPLVNKVSVHHCIVN